MLGVVAELSAVTLESGDGLLIFGFLLKTSAAIAAQWGAAALVP
jgi:hypothetical protein